MIPPLPAPSNPAADAPRFIPASGASIACTEASGAGSAMWTAGATAWAVFLARFFLSVEAQLQLANVLLQLQQLSAAFSAPMLCVLEPIWPAPLHQLRYLQLPHVDILPNM